MIELNQSPDWEVYWQRWTSETLAPPQWPTEGPGGVCRLLPMLQNSGDLPELAPLLAGLPPVWQVRAAWLLGSIHMSRLDNPQAEECLLRLEARLPQAKEQLSGLDLGRIQNMRGRLAARRGEHQAAIAFHQSALAAFALDHRTQEMAYALTNKGNALSRLKRPHQALDIYTRALELLPNLHWRGNKTLVGLLMNLSVLCYKQGDLLRAQSIASLASREVLGPRVDPGPASNLALVQSILLTELGDYSEAARCLDRAERIAEEIASKARLDAIRSQRAWLAVSAGDLEKGQAILESLPQMARPKPAELSIKLCSAILHAKQSPGPKALMGLLSLETDTRAMLPPSGLHRLLCAAAPLQGQEPPSRPSSPWQEQGEQALHRLDSIIQGLAQQASGLNAAQIGHDLNNLITVLRSELWMLEQDHPDAELTVAIQTTQLLQELTSQFMGRGTERAGVTDLGKALRANATLYRSILGPDIKLELRLPDGPIPLSLSEVDLNKAVLNTLSNARDCLSGGGRVQIGVERGPTGWTLRVDDDGPGIPDAIKEQVLMPYVSTKGTGERGLGLCIIDEVLRHAGGRLEVGDAELGGASIRMSIPAA